MVLLTFISIIFFYFSLAMLFIHYTFRKQGQVVRGKVFGIYRYFNYIRGIKKESRTYYAPIVEYSFKNNDKYFLRGSGSSQIQYQVGQPIEILFFDEARENVIIKDSTYLSFGIVFLIASLACLSLSLHKASPIERWIHVLVFFIITPLILSLVSKKISFTKIRQLLLKSSNIYTEEQLSSLDIIRDNGQLEQLDNKHTKIGITFCSIMLMLTIGFGHYFFEGQNPENLEEIKSFLNAEINWENIGSASKKIIFVTSGILYAAGMLLLGILRLAKKKRKYVDAISVDL